MSMRPITKAVLVGITVFVVSLVFDRFVHAPPFVDALFVGALVLLVAVTSNRNGDGH